MLEIEFRNIHHPAILANLTAARIVDRKHFMVAGDDPFDAKIPPCVNPGLLFGQCVTALRSTAFDFAQTYFASQPVLSFVATHLKLRDQYFPWEIFTLWKLDHVLVIGPAVVSMGHEVMKRPILRPRQKRYLVSKVLTALTAKTDVFIAMPRLGPKSATNDLFVNKLGAKRFDKDEFWMYQFIAQNTPHKNASDPYLIDFMWTIASTWNNNFNQVRSLNLPYDDRNRLINHLLKKIRRELDA